MLDRAVVCVTPIQGCLTGNAFLVSRYHATAAGKDGQRVGWKEKQAMQTGQREGAIGEPGLFQYGRWPSLGLKILGRR